MAEPVSWLALEAIAEVVRAITIANGYRTNLGAGAVVLDDSQLPESDDAIVIIDAGNFETTKTSSKHVNTDMDVTIEYCIPRGPGTTNPKLLAHRGRADLVDALSIREQDLPKCIRSWELIGATLMGFTDEEASTNFVIAQVTARAGLTELKSPAN